MIKVLFVCNFESPYRIEFWNELTRYCDVTILFSETKEQQLERNSKWFSDKKYKFKAVQLKQTKLIKGKHICFDVVNYLKQDFDLIIFHPYAPVTCMYGICYCIRHKIPYVINADGGFAKSGRGFLEKLKNYLISHAEAYLSTANATDAYLSFYGGELATMHRYTLTTVKEEDILADIIPQKNKRELREKLNIKESKVMISVGNMIPRKGFDLLLEAAVDMDHDIGIYIVGGKAPKEYQNYVEEHRLNNIHFLDFMSKEELREFYYASDVFVLPTREDIWGLVVVEAMTCGLPVITTDRCIAGLELIEEGKNGHIYAVNDVDKLAGLINDFFTSNHDVASMQRATLLKSKDFTIEKMAKDHNLIFERILKCRHN